jgi:hypothetical protein
MVVESFFYSFLNKSTELSLVKSSHVTKASKDVFPTQEPDSLSIADPPHAHKTIPNVKSQKRHPDGEWV